MQRALSSRTRASALSAAAAAKYRPGAGLSQQLRFAHKVSKPRGYSQLVPAAIGRGMAGEVALTTQPNLED